MTFNFVKNKKKLTFIPNAPQFTRCDDFTQRNKRGQSKREIVNYDKELNLKL